MSIHMSSNQYQPHHHHPSQFLATVMRLIWRGVAATKRGRQVSNLTPASSAVCGFISKPLKCTAEMFKEVSVTCLPVSPVPTHLAVRLRSLLMRSPRATGFPVTVSKNGPTTTSWTASCPSSVMQCSLSPSHQECPFNCRW